MRVVLTPFVQAVADALAQEVEAGHVKDVEQYVAQVDTRRYSVIVSRDNLGAGGGTRRGERADWRWHISIAGVSEVPRWRDLVAIAHELRPGVPLAIGVPPRSWWMNVHPHCLHLWQLEDENMIAQWRRERQGAAPS